MPFERHTSRPCVGIVSRVHVGRERAGLIPVPSLTGPPAVEVWHPRLLSGSAAGLVASAMPESAILYEEVEVEDEDDLGFTCRIGTQRAFIGKYVPLDGTTARHRGERGRLTLPRWFVEQQNLPLERRLSEPEVEQWFALAKLRVATAKERLERTPQDRDAQGALERATAELASAMALRARRQGEPR